jgi:hypothetical protein
MTVKSMELIEREMLFKNEKIICAELTVCFVKCGSDPHDSAR